MMGTYTPEYTVCIMEPQLLRIYMHIHVGTHVCTVHIHTPCAINIMHS